MKLLLFLIRDSILRKDFGVSEKTGAYERNEQGLTPHIGMNLGGNKLQEFNDVLNILCNMKGCGLNCTHTTKFHGKFNTNPLEYPAALSSTHPYLSMTQNASPLPVQLPASSTVSSTITTPTMTSTDTENRILRTFLNGLNVQQRVLKLWHCMML